MNWRGKKVLVTGAGGFIGSHLTEKLVDLGADTRALVHYRGNGSRGWLDHSLVADSYEVIAGDIRDYEMVQKSVNDRDIIFHLAALIGIPYSYDAPRSYLSTNAEGTLNVLQAARKSELEILIHTSTSEVYGNAQYLPMDESHPLSGQSPYSASKIAADMLAQAYWDSFRVPVGTIRPFNTFGPRQSARAAIPTIISQALTSDVLKLGSLEPIRDFNFVSDTVLGFIRMAESPTSIGQVINVGSGREISIEELASLVLKLVGRPDLPVALDEQRVRPSESEVDRLCADNTKARNLLGWAPAYTLETGLSETIEWVQGNLEKYSKGVYAV